MSEWLNEWYELENCFLDDSKKGYSYRQRGKTVEVPPKDATKAWLFCFKCKRDKRGLVRRQSHVEQLAFEAGKLDETLAQFVERDDVLVIAEQDDRHEYMRYKGETEQIEVH